MHRRTALSGLGALSLSSLSSRLAAQTAPASTLQGRTLKFLVGYPAGGVADYVARTATEGLRATSGATAVVENRPGAAGNIALEALAKAPGDAGIFGMLSSSQITTNPFVPKLAPRNVDPARDLVPVIALVDMVLILAVSSAYGVKTLDQFLAKAREKGAPPLRMGLAGVGTPHHLAALLLERASGIDMLMVPYKGGAPMIADAAGGHLDAVITTLPVGGPMVASGKLEWIAVLAPNPVASLPGVPSLSGVLKGETIPTWNGVFAPASTPLPVINDLHAALKTYLHTPAVTARFRANGLEPLNLSRTEVAARLADETIYMKDFLGKVNVDFST